MNIQTIIDKFHKDFVNDNYSYSTGNFNSKDPVVSKLKQFIKDSLTSMLDGIIENGPQRMEHEDSETEEMKNIVSEHNGCVYDFHKIINSHR